MIVASLGAAVLRMLRPITRLVLLAILGIPLALGPAPAATTGAVQENVPGQANANRHRLLIQNTGGGSQMLSVSCRVQDVAALGFALDFGIGRTWNGTQRLDVIRDGRDRRSAQFVPNEVYLTLGGPSAIDLLGWALDGRSVTFRHAEGAEVTFDLTAVRRDAARFRELCRF